MDSYVPLFWVSLLVIIPIISLAHMNIGMLRRIASSLAVHSFRFNFPLFSCQGQQLRYDTLTDEINDVFIVIKNLADLGYNIIGIIGHSRGANLTYHIGHLLLQARLPLHRRSLLKDLKWIVGIAGRFDMSFGPEKHIGRANVADLLEERISTYDWRINARGAETVVTLTKDNLLRFQQLNDDVTSSIPDKIKADRGFVPSLKIICIHGTDDGQISFLDNSKWADSFRAYVQSKSSLDADNNTLTVLDLLIDDADHCFTKDVHKNRLVAEILASTFFKP